MAAAVGLGLGILSPAAALAGECTSPGGAAAALGEQSVEARLQFIQKSLRDTARLERRYAIGWGLAYVGMAAGTWFLYPFTDDKHGQMISSSWNSATSVAGGINVIIDPLRVIHDQHKLEALLTQSQYQSQSAEKRCAVVAQAEKLFNHVADNQRGAHSPKAHILSFLSTVGLGLILGYGLGRADSAAINTSIGVALGEIMIATRPTIAVRSMEIYRTGELDAPLPKPSLLSWSLVPTSTSTSYGLAWAGTF